MVNIPNLAFNERYILSNDINLRNHKEFLNLNDRSVVQFIHRNLAYIILLLTIYIGYLIKKHNKINFGTNLTTIYWLLLLYKFY